MRAFQIVYYLFTNACVQEQCFPHYWPFVRGTRALETAMLSPSVMRIILHSLDITFLKPINKLFWINIGCPLICFAPLHKGCDLCASLVRLQNLPGCRWRHIGGWKVALVVQWWAAQRTFRPRHGRHGRHEVLSIMLKQSHKVAGDVGRSQVAQRRQGEAHTLPWSQNGCTGVGHWSPRKQIRTVVNIVSQFERRFCLLCTTIVPPLANR